MTRGIDRRRFAVGSAGLIASAHALAAPDNSDVALDANVLRVVFESPETGFDPAQVSDLYSVRVNSHIFEAMLGYDPLAVPVRLVPLTAETMPEASADFTVWTVRLRRGIRFADDPAFKGRPRELVAEDYVYALKRIYDPAFKSPSYTSLGEDGILRSRDDGRTWEPANTGLRIADVWGVEARSTGLICTTSTSSVSVVRKNG